MDIKEVMEFLYKKYKENETEICDGMDCCDCPFQEFTNCPNSIEE